MANPFAITAASNSVSLRNDRTGQAAFTVFNASGRPIRGRARIVAEDPIAEQWLSLIGDAERAFGIAGTEQFVVQIKAPVTAPAGDMRFRLDMVDVENPDENYSQGSSVTFQVPEAPAPSKSFPWWIVAVAAGVIILIGMAFVIGGEIRGRADDARATQQAVAQTQTAAAITPTETPTDIPLGFRIEDFTGTWVNVDENTPGITRLIIRKVDDGTVSLQGFCGHGPIEFECEWGVINTTFTPPRIVADGQRVSRLEGMRWRESWEPKAPSSLIGVTIIVMRSGDNLMVWVIESDVITEATQATSHTLRRRQ